MLYASTRLYADGYDDNPRAAGSRAAGAVASWERKLREVNALCGRISGLTTLLLTVHPEPRFGLYENEEAVLASLRVVRDVPRVDAEILGRKLVSVRDDNK